MPRRAWSDIQRQALVHQIVVEGRKLPDLDIPGRTAAALNNERYRLRGQGLLGESCPVRKVKLYNMRELNDLKRYAAMGFSAGKIYGMLPGRSKDSISQAMRRNSLGNPRVRARAKLARRLDSTTKKRLESYVLDIAKVESSDAVAEKFDIRVKQVHYYRRKLGVAPSWHDARNTTDHQAKKEERHNRNSVRMKAVWARRRRARRAQFENEAAKLIAQETDLRPRICKTCSGIWYANALFYHAMSKRTKDGLVKKLFYRVCRLCRSAARRKKDDLTNPSARSPVSA
jgi:hypothetical protein